MLRNQALSIIVIFYVTDFKLKISEFTSFKFVRYEN